MGLALLAACSGEERDEGPPSPPPNPLIHEIADADGTVRGWLFGTIHALPDGTEWRTPAIEDAIAQADLLLVEIDDLEDRAGIAATFARLATTPGLAPLPERIVPSLRPELAMLMDEAGLTNRESERIETWAAALMLARLKRDGEPANGVDRAIIADFGAGEVRELEGAAAQLAIFDRLAETDQRDLLREVVAGSGEVGADPAVLRRAWLAGKEGALLEASTTGILADRELREALLVDRNRAWLPAILSALDDDARPLVAVGAAHVVGPDGLAALLAARGYRVTVLR